jgi:hypothetical protein
MSITQVYWDSDFKVKSLTPHLRDGNGVTGNIAIATSGTTTLQLPISGTKTTKAIKIFNHGSQDVEVTMEIYINNVLQTGNVVMSILKQTSIEFPTESVTSIKLTNSGSHSATLSVLYLLG